MSRKPLIGLGIAVLLLVGVELALRLFVPRERLLFEWERPNGLVAHSDAGLLVSKPDMTQSLRDGPYPWDIRTNDLGLREDAPVPAAKEPGSLRILALGDSWMFGFSVDQGKTIPDQLERLLPPKLGGRKVEVLNAGVFGSCAFDMLQRYRWFVDTWELDGVLLGQPHNRARAEATADARSAWYRTVAGRPALDLHLYLLLRRWIAPLRTPLYAEPPQGDEALREIADLRTLAADARRRGLQVWFLELPSHMEQALAGYEPDGAWRVAMTEEGAPYGGHGLPERACWGFIDRGHPSEAGARVIAEVMADVIAGAGPQREVRRTPTCAEVEEAGPGKAGWAWAD